jgi:hypothetical protein
MRGPDTAPANETHALRAVLAATASYVVLTVVLTWPAVRGISRDLVADFGDPLLNTWILAWDASHLSRAIAGHPAVLGEYWDANIYDPHPLALGYSEHLTAQAVMILPLYAATGNAILAYNVVILSTFVLSAAGMFLFVRELTTSSGAAFVAGLAFGFAPYRFGTLPHIQVLSSMWMPFALLGFHRFLDSRRLAPLAGAAAAWLAQNLSCGYYLLFFSPAIALYLALEIGRRRLWSDRRVLFGVVIAAAAVGLCTVPFLIPYLRLRHLGFSPRSLTETIRYSADVLAYGTIDVGMWLWGNVVRAWPRPEGSLFPGFTILFLSAGAIVSCWRGTREDTPAESVTTTLRVVTALLVITTVVTMAILAGWSLHLKIGGVDVRLTSLYRGLLMALGLAVTALALSRYARRRAYGWIMSPVGTFTLMTIFAFAMSLGPQISARGRVVEEWSLYGLFYDYVPGFDGLRVPARFAMVAVLGLAALAGCGAAAFTRRRGGGYLLALAAALMIVESWAVPIPVNVNSTEYKQSGLLPLPGTLPTAAELPAVYRFVEQHLPASSVLLELPFGEIAFETRYMFYSTFHWRRLVNGYSGGGPDEYGLRAERLKEILASPDEAWRTVLETRATHIIIHEGSYAGDRGQLIGAWAVSHGAREVGAFGSDRLFTVPR